MRVADRQGWLTLVAVVVVAAVALALRVPHLERRPLHNDEANQAYKAGALVETGVYQYDPREHHGPSLYYLTLPLAWLQSGGSFARTEIWVYRAVPVAFGAMLCLMVLAGGRALGRPGALAAALLTAVSPSMVYFSRFYIQEMLLVTFTFGLLCCAWQCLRRPSLGWAAAAGVSAGLMCATKETCVLAWAALAGAALVYGGLRRRAGEALVPAGLGWRHAAMALAAGGAVVLVLFSSFFSHWRGVLDSLLALGVYVGRGANADAAHRHPFGFYLRLLTFSHPAPGVWWGEDAVLFLGLVGGVCAWAWPGRLRGEALAVRLLSVYTVLLALIYSAIPYKTPWCLLSWWHGWILLAGVGAAVLVRLPRRALLRGLVAVVLVTAMAQLARRAWLASGRYAAHQRNPLVYAQTGTDLLRLVERVEALSAVSPEGRALRVHVIAPPDHTWPLPWYLRRLPQVGYWTGPEAAALAGSPALIISTPDLADGLPEALAAGYVAEYYGLRPEVLLSLHIRKDLWARFLETRSGTGT